MRSVWQVQDEDACSAPEFFVGGTVCADEAAGCSKIGPFRFGLIAFSIPATGIQRSPVIFIVISTVVFVSKTNLISFVQLALRWPPPIKNLFEAKKNLFKWRRQVLDLVVSRAMKISIQI